MMIDISLPSESELVEQGFVKFFIDTSGTYWKKGDSLLHIKDGEQTLISSGHITNIVDSHNNLYTEKVEDFCKTQQQLLKYLEIYVKIKKGSLSETEVNSLYEQMNSDCDYEEYYDYEEYGSKINFLEFESLRLINCYKSSLTEGVKVSIHRLDNLLLVLDKGE